MTKPGVEGGCTCRRVQFRATGKPLFRAYCHCTICQSFNNADFADILVMRSRDVSVKGRESVVFKVHRNPPLLKRGRCSDCGGVAIEEMSIPLLPKLTIIPLQTLDQPTDPPLAQFHMFYHRRDVDVDDALPKHSGYVSSQMRFSRTLLRELMNGGSAS